MQKPTFRPLEPEDLATTKDKANDGLKKQHVGVGDSILTGPKSPSALGTLGETWSFPGVLGDSRSNSQRNMEDTAAPKDLEKVGLFSVSNGWKINCEYEGCKWDTEVLSEGQVSTLAKMYELHVQKDHKNEAGTELDKEKDAYEEATRLKDIPAHTDNRLDILSPVRFYPFPLQYQHIAKNQPAKQSPVWPRLDLSHVGLQLVDNSIVSKLHNRAYTGAQLRHFSETNLKLDPEDKGLVLRPIGGSQGGLKQTRHVRYINTIDDATMALLNCELIMRHLHPMDYGTTALVRFLLDRIHHQHEAVRITNPNRISNFFQAAFKANADRVLGPAYPRTYQEVSTFYSSMDWTAAFQGAGLRSESEREVSMKGRGGGKMGDKRGAGESPYRGKARKLQESVCYEFNKSGGCARRLSPCGKGCVSKGDKVFLHICSRSQADGSGCGSSSHGASQHV